MLPRRLAVPTVLGLAPALAYWLWLRGLVAAYLVGSGPEWFARVAEWLYPRLPVERQRFGPDFFVQKADQVIFRWLMVVFAIGFLYFLVKNQPGLRERLRTWWGAVLDAPTLARLRVGFYLATLWFTWPWWAELRAAAGYADFFRPVWLIAWLGGGFPSRWAIDLGFGVYLAAVGLAALGVRATTSGWVAAVGFLLAQAHLQSFEKADHGFATWTYGMVLLPVLLATRPAAYALRLIQVAVAGAYLLAALEKLLVSGGAWVSAGGFRAQLRLHPTLLGLQIADNEWLCWLLPAAGWLFQFGFWLVLVAPRLRWVFLPGGVLFHTGTYLLLGAGAYWSPWWAMYLFFLPKLTAKSQEKPSPSNRNQTKN
jgi:hypothetical protein